MRLLLVWLKNSQTNNNLNQIEKEIKQGDIDERVI